MTSSWTRAAAGLLRAALCLALLAAPAAAQAKAAKLRANDAIGRPGRAIELLARLQSELALGIGRDVSKEPIDFFLVAKDGAALPEAKFLGTGETDGDGKAAFTWTPEGPGTWRVEARVRRGSGYVALPAPAVVAVPPPERTVIVVHLDGTASPATNLNMFRGTDNAQLPLADGAKLALGLLAQPYQLVYLTDLDASFGPKFRDWLALHELPEAPVLFWELFTKAFAHATYVEQSVARLRKDLPATVIGVGAQASDAQAFLGHGLTAIVLGSPPPAGLPDEVAVARRWEEVLGHVAMSHGVARRLDALAGEDAAAADEALAELALLGQPGLAYVHRHRRDGDPARAAAAALVAGRIRASQAFLGSLDLSSANQALAGLLAAWRAGDRAVVVALHRDRKAGLEAEVPALRSCRLVSRNEPEPGKVVYRLRLVPREGEPRERELAFVRGDDARWLVDAAE